MNCRKTKAKTKSFKETKAARNNLPIEEEGQELQCLSHQKPCKKRMEFFKFKHKKKNLLYPAILPIKSEGKIGFIRQTKSEVIHHPHICPARNVNKFVGHEENNNGKYWGYRKKGRALKKE